MLAPSCSQVGCQISVRDLAPREAPGAWLQCGRGGNTLPLPTRLQAAGQSPAGLQLASTLGCLRQLTGDILDLHAADAPALTGLPSLCAVGAAAIGAESIGLVTARQLLVGAALAPDPDPDADPTSEPDLEPAPDPNPDPDPDPNQDPDPAQVRVSSR